ncbi:hypothetical protein DSO57_1024493 [Entomophthora muscae]|uniref:Uncharacterized protein n=1 Tax=Entomophthora muscae TaxID=34485 RepID=A0ACC2SFW7_9FUNG|nr:hypothetical protein DSO57_1024493 [Entomophthora muscae]
MAKKKVTKKSTKDAFPDEPSPVPTGSVPEIEEEEEKAPVSAFALLDEDDDGGLMNMISRAAKKKNKKSKPVHFDSDEDKVLDISTKLGSDEEEDVFGQIVSKKGKKSKSNALSFGSLEDLEEDDLGMAPAKKGKKKKNKKELPSFDALEIEEAEEPAEEVELPKEKKKSKKSKNALTFDALNEDNVDEIEDAPPQNSKAKGNNGKHNSVDSDKFLIAEEKPESVHGNKKGNKLKKEEDDLDALAALIEDSSVQPSGKGKKNKKKKLVVDEDLDALAALIEDTSVVPKTPGKGKRTRALNPRSQQLRQLPL